MKKRNLREDLEFMPNEKGNVSVKHVVDSYKSSKTKNKTSDLEVKKNLKPATTLDLQVAKAVLKDLKSKGKDSDVTKKCNIDPKPDVVMKANGDVEINPDNGKDSYKISAKELKKFEENLQSDDNLYLELSEKGREKFWGVDEHGNPSDEEMSEYFDNNLRDVYFFDVWSDVIPDPEAGPEFDSYIPSGIFTTTPEKLVDMFENESNAELDDFVVGCSYKDEVKIGEYGPEQRYQVTDVIEDLYSIWETDDLPFKSDPIDSKGMKNISSEPDYRWNENVRRHRHHIRETMDTFDGICPYCGNRVDPDSTECDCCGLDLSY